MSFKNNIFDFVRLCFTPDYPALSWTMEFADFPKKFSKKSKKSLKNNDSPPVTHRKCDK